MKPLLLAAALLLGCAGSGTAVDPDPFRRGLWPLYTGDARGWADVQESRALGPLLHWERNGAQRLFESRPAFSSLVSPSQRRRDVLYPLVGCREHAARDICSVFLLASSRHDRLDDTRWWHLGPVYWGRTSSGRRYGGLFPLFGFFRERLGFDRIRFLLWPLFARAHHGAYTETQILWPLFAWGSGGDRSMLRLWPLYGVSRQENVYTKRYFFWPLIHVRTERLASDQPMRTLLVLPLYGRRDVGPESSRLYLFPLLLRYQRSDMPEVGRLDVLWPFYTRARGADGSREHALRPFYVGQHRNGEDRRSWLLGMVERVRVAGDAGESRSWRLLWAGRRRVQRQDGRELRHFDLWPLYRSRRVREPDGLEHGYVRVPYLLPMRGSEPDAWNRHYNQLFELYGRRWRDDQTRSSLLFGLRETRRSAEVVWESWAGLVHLRRAVDPD